MDKKIQVRKYNIRRNKRKSSPPKRKKQFKKRVDMTDAEYIKYLEMENDVLKKTYEVEVLTGSNKYVKYQVINTLSNKDSVSTLCMYLGASTSTYYLYQKRNPIKYDKHVMELVKQLHSQRISSGYRTITMQLKRRHNLNINHKKVYRIMQYLHIKGKQHRRKYSFKKAIQRSITFDNILNRNFKCTKSNKNWSIDITYVLDKTRNTYLVCIKDLYDKRIVSFENSNTLSEKFVLSCVRNAFESNNVNDSNLIIHSDQGSHFTSKAYVSLLGEFNVIGSHSRKGNCHDNSPIKSFFSIFKREAFNFELPKSFDHTKQLTNDFINYYNNERGLYNLNKKTPCEYYSA